LPCRRRRLWAGAFAGERRGRRQDNSAAGGSRRSQDYVVCLRPEKLIRADIPEKLDYQFSAKAFAEFRNV